MRLNGKSKITLTRRQFIQTVSTSLVFNGLGNLIQAAPGKERKPNFLWISCEDIGPTFGCYGDPDAITPTIDALAKEKLGVGDAQYTLQEIYMKYFQEV